MAGIFAQEPDSKTAWEFDWTDVLDTGETISTNAFAINPTGPTLSGEQNNDPKTQVTVDGLTHGILYRLDNKITTSAGRTLERSLFIRGWQPL